MVAFTIILHADKAIVSGSVYCRRCGRELTDPRSKLEGIGRECKKKEEAENAREGFSYQEQTFTAPNPQPATWRELDAPEILFLCMSCRTPAVLKQGLCLVCRNGEARTK